MVNKLIFLFLQAHPTLLPTQNPNQFQHDVDAVIEVPELGKAVQFSRFNQGGEMNIFDNDLPAAA